MSFIHNQFLLESSFAETLFHEYAKGQPIIDYHCHLDPKEIAEDRTWDNISQIWLGGDHYKWRAMRSNGVSEDYCTGDKGDREKFQRWAETVPQLLRNPLYHWTHLEMSRYFDMDDLLLSPKTADEVWTRSYELLNSGKFSAKQLITKSHVEVVCTTDDPIDDLSHHHAIAEDSSFSCRVLPTWRPDKAMAVECPEDWNAYIEKLENASQLDITHFSDFIQALENRHDYFHSMGCRISDHGIEKCYGRDFTENQLAQIFEKLKKKEALHEIEIDTFKSGMMYHFARMDHEKSWTQQIHYGALRNNNSLMYNKLGPDVGFDSIASTNTISEMARMLDHQNRDGCLPKTIIYNLNPSDNECVATMLGNFQDGNIAGKMQMGSGWWFLDQKDGMERQIESLSQLGLLSRFVGMLTDSRSFLSYTRHEYFRRILCNILGNDIKKGLIPEDMELVGQMVSNICSHNAKSYFAFDA